MNDVVRKEVCRVFLWLYQGGNKPVWEYLDEVQAGKSGLNKDEKNTLKKREPATNMDISLLYRLLQRTCGLAEANAWASPPAASSASLEHTLYLIKEERNKLGHEGHTREAREMSDAELGRKLSHLRRLCAHLLEEAARRCGRTGETVKLVDRMEARLQAIQGVTPDRFVLMAREEKLRAARTKTEDEWYQQPLLRLQGQAVQLADLLQRQAAGGAAPGFLLVSGEAGAGKSSLCRYLEECWLRPRSDGKDLLQRYQLVLKVRCGDICTCDAMRLLQEELLPEAASRCSRETLADILCFAPILWVLDGLEEATEEAKKLLSSFLRNPRPKSTVLLTSRPEFGQDFLKRHPNDGVQLVSLLGTDPLEAIDGIILSTKADEDTLRHAKSLKEEFRKLEPHVQVELQNPLKLRLALQGWEAMRTSTLRREFELSRLYQRITDAQIESLSEKVSQGSTMTKSEATRKVKKWFSFFCESTFHLVRNGKVFVGATREEFLKELEDKCDDLGISSSKCMPTFLAKPDSVFSTDNSSYTFYHDSQVHFLAALHIASVMRGSSDLLTDTLALFNITALHEQESEAPPLLRFFPVLLLLVSLIDASTPGDNTRMRVQLLLNAIPFRFATWAWFKVARKASYEHKVMREIGRVIPAFWEITDPEIEAAMKMLQYQHPKVVAVRVFSKPEEVKELKPLICTLASLPVAIFLELVNQVWNLSWNDTADAYLEIICRTESRCVLIGLQAHLGNVGYGLLRHPKIMEHCKFMKMKVNSIKSLETLCEYVQRFQSMKKLNLVIAMKDLPYTSAKLPNVIKGIFFPFITKETAANTAKFAARLSSSYNEILVNDMPLSAIETFLLCLEKRSVTVKKIRGYLQQIGLVSQKREIVPRAVEFGPLPLAYSREEFRHRWSEYRSLVRLTRLTGDA